MQAVRREGKSPDTARDFLGIERRSYSVPEIAYRNNTSALTIWRALASGALKGKKIGRRTVILAEDEAVWLAGLPTTGGRAA